MRNTLVLARACNWVAGSTTSAKAARAAVLTRGFRLAISPAILLPFPNPQYSLISLSAVRFRKDFVKITRAGHQRPSALAQPLLRPKEPRHVVRVTRTHPPAFRGFKIRAPPRVTVKITGYESAFRCSPQHRSMRSSASFPFSLGRVNCGNTGQRSPSSPFSPP